MIAERVCAFSVVGLGAGMLRWSSIQRKESSSWDVELRNWKAEERCFGDGSCRS